MKNGLYVIEIAMLDGITGVNRGVMAFRDGMIRGGDPFFYYTGSYSADGTGRWKGELLNREHTPSRGEKPIFGGKEVGIGFNGTYNDRGAEADCTALAGKLSIRFKATLRLLVED